MLPELKNKILNTTGAKKIIDTQLIQKLWSGYGELSRVHLDNGSVILKHIKFPEEFNHPRRWNTDEGHKRKIFSYEVERFWYEKYNANIEGAYFPHLIDCGEFDNTQFMILEDLANKEFETLNSASWKEVELCLSWLAHFHRYHLGRSREGLWEVGTYWHLETRPDELEALDDQKLKDAAPLIDKKLNEAVYKTVVHGDAKLANFLFTKDEVSAVDFQYVGGGVGVKDVAYFLSSVFNADELEKYETKALDYYFKMLNLTEVEKEWRELYPYAWCDFYRFLAGWSPGHPKINFYSKGMKDKVLKCL